MRDVLTYHVDAARSGLNSDFVFDNADVSSWEPYATIPTNATVRAAPLYVAGYIFLSGPHTGETHDVVIVAASDNMVYAYAEDQLLAGIANPLWAQSLGRASTRSSLNPKMRLPIGISGTPVIDRASAKIFVMAWVGEDAAEVFTIFILDLNTGHILDRAALHDAGAAGRPTFDSTAQDQRGALNLVNGWIYATFADILDGDQGEYYGWIVAIDQSILSTQLFLATTRTVWGGGLWGQGGAAAAPNGTLYASTGNAIRPPDSKNPKVGNDDLGPEYWNTKTGKLARAQVQLGPAKFPGDIGDYFEGVIGVQRREGPAGSSLAVVDWYQPAWTPELQNDDLDFGGSSPIVLPVIEGHQFVITTAKDGNVYLLDGTNLGRWGHQALWTSVRDEDDPKRGAFFIDVETPDTHNESKCAPAYFHDRANGAHYVYVVGNGRPGLGAFKIEVTGPKPKLTAAWNAGEFFPDGPSSPFVIANPAGTTALVWVASNNRLLAFDAVSGGRLFDRILFGGSYPRYAPLVGAGKSIFVAFNRNPDVTLRIPESYGVEAYRMKEFDRTTRTPMVTVLFGVTAGGSGVVLDANGKPSGVPAPGPLHDILPLLAAYHLVMSGTSQERLVVGSEIMKAVSKIAATAASIGTSGPTV